MKLRLKEKEQPSVQLRLTLPGSLKESLDEYVGYLRDKLQRETDCKEVAIEMLKHFVESDRDFRSLAEQAIRGIAAITSRASEEG